VKKLLMSLVLCCFALSVVSITGCGKKDKEETKKTEEVKKTEKKGE